MPKTSAPILILLLAGVLFVASGQAEVDPGFRAP